MLGDLNAKLRSWSLSADNQKGKELLSWLSTNSLEIVNKHVATSTRSDATIDVILAPTHMQTKSSFSVLPSFSSDHLLVVWTPALNLKTKGSLFTIKRTYWTLIELFLTYTYWYWHNLSSRITDRVPFFSTYERFLALLASRVTFVSYQSTYKPSLPPHSVGIIQDKHPFLITQLKTLSGQFAWQRYCQSLNTGTTKQFCRKARNVLSR